MNWNPIDLARYIGSWFVHDDKQFQKILDNQEELRGLLQSLLNQGDRIMADLATVKADLAKLQTDVTALKTNLNQQIADLKAQIAAGSPVTQADLDALDATINAIDTTATTP